MLQEPNSIFESTFTENAKAHLLETTRWTKFLAILGFIGLGLMTAVLLFTIASGASMAPQLGSVGTVGMIIFFVLIIALYIYPTTMLYQFSKYTKQALTDDNLGLLEKGFRCQKNMFKFMGILSIIVILFYVALIGFAVIQSI